MAETSPSFTVTMNDGKSTQPEQPVPEPASKQLTWTDGKQTVKYTATAEMLPLHTDDGTLIGHMFALSYVSDAADKSDRPVTFVGHGEHRRLGPAPRAHQLHQAAALSDGA